MCPLFLQQAAAAAAAVAAAQYNYDDDDEDDGGDGDGGQVNKISEGFRLILNTHNHAFTLDSGE